MELTASDVFFICIHLIATDCRVNTVWVRDRNLHGLLKNTRQQTEERAKKRILNIERLNKQSSTNEGLKRD